MKTPVDEKFSTSQWLNSQGLGQYAPKLAENGVNRDVLFSLTDADLKECGIKSLGDRKRLLGAIGQLKSIPPNSGRPQQKAQREGAAPAELMAPSLDHSNLESEQEKTKESPGVLRSQATKSDLATIPGGRSEATSSGGSAINSKRPLQDRFGGRFLYISIFLHVLLAVLATWFVVQRSEARRKLTFQGTAKSGNPGANALTHKIQMTKKKNTMSAPAPSKRITTTAASARVAIPELAMPRTSSGSSAQNAMGGVVAGASFSVANTIAGPDSGGAKGSIPFFGLRTSNSKAALVGSFFDLKQTSDGKPTEMAGTLTTGSTQAQREAMLAENNALGVPYWAELKHLVKAGFSGATLSKYYRAPTQLYATQIFIPRIPADKCPEEFGVQDRVKPRRWIVHYEAKVSPAVSGRYHFVGYSDDALVVKFNGRMVLDGCLHAGVVDWMPKRVFNYEPLKAEEKMPKRSSYNVLAEGDSFEAQAGSTYNLDIAIGECPGGSFTAVLMLEKDGETYKKDGRGNPIFPIFKLAAGTNPQPPKGSAPVFAPDTQWSVWKPYPKTGSDSGLNVFKTAK